MNEITLTRNEPRLAALDRPSARLAHIGALLMISGHTSVGTFSVVEHPIDALSLAAPYHTHTREDEYSIVLEGEVGFALDDDVVVGRAGDTIFKPRDVRHAFWNAGTGPARILEIISPAGFEKYFFEVGEVFAAQGPLDTAALATIAAKYGLRMERESAPALIERHGLRP
jgi:uncharacterized cupin superfamily protein